LTPQERTWSAYLRHELPEAERAAIQRQIIETEGYAEALADFEYRLIDEQARQRDHWRVEILAIAATVLLAVLWVLRPTSTPSPTVFLAAGILRDAATVQTVTLPSGPQVTFELELPDPPPGGRCEALGQSGDCSGRVFRLTLPRPAAGRQQIELRQNGRLVSVYVYQVQ
jgi:hypothetical protein